MADALSESVFSIEEKHFHDLVRDWVICLLVLLTLLSASYVVLLLFRREPETDDFSSSDKEDTAVYHAAFLICVFTLSASFLCTFLLPASVASNEILLMYPDSYYLQWVNGSLVSKLWDLTFYFSRALIFLLLPFIYLFTEAIGFVGMRQGVMARVYEAVAVMILVGFVLFGLFFLGMALVYSYDEIFISDVWNFLDRLATTLGLLFLLISTPVGYAALFTAAARKSLPFLERRPNASQNMSAQANSSFNIMSSAAAAERSDVLIMEKELLLRRRHVSKNHSTSNGSLASPTGDIHTSPSNEDNRLDMINKELMSLEQRLEINRGMHRKILSWLSIHSTLFRHLSPLICAFLAFGLAVLSAMSTLFTVFERALTSRTLANYDEKLRLGHESLSRLGIFGSSLGLVLQLSCAIAALIGIYYLPLFKLISPRRGDTPMTRLILNGAIWIVLAQAFPTFSSCLGLSNFQLLSGFRSSSEWFLNSAYIIFIIDAAYILFVALNLVNALTAPLVRDFVDFIVARWHRIRRSNTATVATTSSSDINSPTLVNNQINDLSSCASPNGLLSQASSSSQLCNKEQSFAFNSPGNGDSCVNDLKPGFGHNSNEVS